MLTAALLVICVLFAIGMIVMKVRIDLLRSDKADLELDKAKLRLEKADLETKLESVESDFKAKLKERVKDTFVLPTAKLQLWDKVLDRHGVEYTVTDISLSYGINNEHPHWSYKINQSDDMKILGSGYVIFSGIYDFIFDKDIGTKYFVRSGNAQATVQTQNLIKNAGGHHALHS